MSQATRGAELTSQQRLSIRFLQSYSKHNITFWGLTTQNEPTDGLESFFNFNAVGWTPKEQVGTAYYDLITVSLVSVILLVWLRYICNYIAKTYSSVGEVILSKCMSYFYFFYSISCTCGANRLDGGSL